MWTDSSHFQPPPPYTNATTYDLEVHHPNFPKMKHKPVLQFFENLRQQGKLHYNSYTFPSLPANLNLLQHQNEHKCIQSQRYLQQYGIPNIPPHLALRPQNLYSPETCYSVRYTQYYPTTATQSPEPLHTQQSPPSGLYSILLRTNYLQCHSEEEILDFFIQYLSPIPVVKISRHSTINLYYLRFAPAPDCIATYQHLHNLCFVEHGRPQLVLTPYWYTLLLNTNWMPMQNATYNIETISLSSPL